MSNMLYTPEFEDKEDFKMLFPFGPKIGAGKLPEVIYDEFEKIVLDVLDKKEEEYNRQLAGAINSEYLITESILKKSKTGKFLDLIVVNYVKNCLSTQRDLSHEDLEKNVAIASRRVGSWVNEMKSYEYNPVHFHPNCDLSTVFFFSDLDEKSFYSKRIDEIHGKFKRGNPKEHGGGSEIDGILEFIYGSSANQLETSCFKVIPRKGDYYIIPSYLLHTVYPFKSNKTRISASINYQYKIGEIDENTRKRAGSKGKRPSKRSRKKKQN